MLLGIDIGTSRLKAAVYDGALQMLQETSVDARAVEGPRMGELDANKLWRVLRDLLADLLTSVDSSAIVAAGITGMAELGCLIDADARPVTPMLLWHDRRGMRQAAALRRTAGDKLVGATGLALTSVRSIAKWMWMVDHGASRAARWCGAPEWIAAASLGLGGLIRRSRANRRLRRLEGGVLPATCSIWPELRRACSRPFMEHQLALARFCRRSRLKWVCRKRCRS